LASGTARGVLSLVFRAFDQAENRLVALKFYDIDPVKLANDYRRDAFRREHNILQSLIGSRRCLQVGSKFSTYALQIPNASGTPLELPCHYFAVEWLEEDIDQYFEQQDSYDPIEKLKLFNDIVLGVEALHRHDVYHRDLKKDNFRAHLDGSSRIVVAIDLGSAARWESVPLSGDYGNGVGAPAYSAPEAICGLAGIRQLGRYIDTYALGCMLFELFNRDLFFYELLARNPNYFPILTAMGAPARSATTASDKLSRWKDALRRHSNGVTPVSILALGHSVPLGIAPLLDGLVQLLTRIDYSSRPHSLEFVRRRVQSAIMCLQNERLYQIKLAEVKARRADRIARILRKQERLSLAQARRRLNAK